MLSIYWLCLTVLRNTCRNAKRVNQSFINNLYIYKHMDYSKVVSKERMEKAAVALKANGNFEVYIEETGEAAKERVLSLIPQSAEVMNMTSVTLDTIGLAQAI